MGLLKLMLGRFWFWILIVVVWFWIEVRFSDSLKIRFSMVDGMVDCFDGILFFRCGVIWCFCG